MWFWGLGLVFKQDPHPHVCLDTIFKCPLGSESAPVQREAERDWNICFTHYKVVFCFVPLMSEWFVVSMLQGNVHLW